MVPSYPDEKSPLLQVSLKYKGIHIGITARPGANDKTPFKLPLLQVSLKYKGIDIGMTAKAV